jgi:hypothetical protein
VAYLTSPQVDTPTGSAGLNIWNVATPTTPQVLATVYSAYDNAGVAVSGTLAVVAAPNNLGLKMLDASVPARPRLVGTVAGTMVGVAAAGSYAYALQVVPGNPAHTDLASVNLSTPSAPAIVGRVTLAGGTDIKVVGTLAYVAVGAAGLQIVNVANPAAPVIVGTMDTPGTAKGVAVAGGYAYVADTTSVQVINVGTPSAPVRVGTLAASAALAVDVVGTKLYVIDGSTQFKTVNVATPSAPQLLSTSNSYAAQRVSVAGTQAMLVTPTLTHATAGGGVYVVDVANALQPVLRRYIVVPGTTRSVVATSTLVYAGDTAALLNVVDPAR